MDVGAVFANNTAMIEDMHGVAVNEQSKDLFPDEAIAFFAMLLSEIAGLERQVAAASEALQR